MQFHVMVKYTSALNIIELTQENFVHLCENLHALCGKVLHSEPQSIPKDFTK